MTTKMTNSNFYNHNIATEISELHDLGLMAFNNTSSNDVCDSIAFYTSDKLIKRKIFFPNAEITDIEQELFNQFQVETINCYYEEVLISRQFNTWNEVLEYIKEINL
jgi:hypothetical protein